MKYTIAFLAFICFTNYCYSQSTIYNNEKSGYDVKIPSWLTVQETDTAFSFGGTMPAVNNIENAILITGFSKNKFASFTDFQRIYITGNVFGKETLYSKDQIWYGRNERDFVQIKNGVSSRVFIFFSNRIYHNQFVLLETSKAYLWIQFTSTSETYSLNISKFNDFLNGLNIK
jgi:hypothetical protein